jgi:hypothetical protein
MTNDISLAIAAPEKVSRTEAISTTRIAPAHMPQTSRTANIRPSVGARAATTEQTSMTTIAPRRTMRRPNRSVNKPAGICPRAMPNRKMVTSPATDDAPGASPRSARISRNAGSIMSMASAPSAMDAESMNRNSRLPGSARFVEVVEFFCPVGSWASSLVAPFLGFGGASGEEFMPSTVLAGLIGTCFRRPGANHGATDDPASCQCERGTGVFPIGRSPR